MNLKLITIVDPKAKISSNITIGAYSIWMFITGGLLF